MSRTAPVTIVNVGYRSTNYWVVSAGRSRLLIDLGYPGTMRTMLASLKRMGVPLEEIRYALATHYHIDHAGLAQEFKQAGVPLLVLETQASAIADMKRWTKPEDRYVEHHARRQRADFIRRESGPVRAGRHRGDDRADARTLV